MKTVGKQILRMRRITKDFPGTKALSGVSFDLIEGEVHALVGENGAGKSTLMKILSGVYQPTSGEIELMGESYTGFNPKEAHSHSISIIYQELSLINQLSIAENLFLGRLPHKRRLGMKIVDAKRMNSTVKRYLDMVGLDVGADELVENLKISQKQLVEIAKALSLESKVLIMDEPTSSISAGEIDRLLSLIMELKKHGVAIVFISHKLKEVKRVADRVTILKDGRVMGTHSAGELSIDDIVSLMVGRELEFKYSHEHRYHQEPRRADVPVLEVKNLSVNDRIGDVNFTVYKKEIVGFFGLVGAGRTEVMRAIFGADRHLGGTIALHGDASRIRNPYAALKRGIGLIPENRREEGVLGNFSIWQNISLPHLQKNSRFQGLVGSTNPKREKTLAQKYRDLLKVKSTSLGQMITELSGGNQQKVVVAKWLASDAEILIFDEPTKGIDVGSKNDIYQIILELAASGKTIIVVSSESEELLSICSRIYVLHEGQIVAEYPIEEATEETLIYSATVEPTGKETGANG